ncbi:MAG: hypothetical protein KatS3mg076_3218 [Candidatus Binatia bacterium]|nr:MAG: hypothetical protein KatS3mg076_3218 [Candidatus Binatia bacterium]
MALEGVFLAVHLEYSLANRIRSLWPRLEELVALSDRYGFRITLQFSVTWAEYVYANGLLSVVHGWEAEGHEIALHHHGPTHKFFDGYTNRPDLVRTDGWYATDGTYRGDMEALLDFLAPLTTRGIVSAGMSDAETDWPAGLLYHATKKGEDNAKTDLLSVPWVVVYDGHTVLAAANAGYGIEHLGDAAVTLADIEDGLRTGTSEEVMGIVLSDDTLENAFADIEPLFDLLSEYGVVVETVRDVLGRFPFGAPTPTATPGAENPRQPFPAVEDAVYTRFGDVSAVEIPHTECANFTATPIVVGDWLVYPAHEFSRDCDEEGPYARTLFGYHMPEGRLYRLYEGATGEAPLLYSPELDTVFWNVTFGGNLFLLDPRSFAPRQSVSLGATADGSGTVLGGLYYLGTVNSPDPVCQNPVNPACGALFAVDGSGTVVRELGLEDGFRAWVGSGVTTDGEFLYVGTAAQTVGVKTGQEDEYLHGCSVTKLTPDLRVVAAFDPGDPGCYALPFQGANLDSVAGEVVLGPDRVWVLYVRPNDERLRVALYVLDYDLVEQCRLEFDFEPRTQAAGFYSAPTLDSEGTAYVPLTVPWPEGERKALLLAVEPDCSSRELAGIPGRWAWASPTLADDRYVLFATDGELRVLGLEGSLVRTYPLRSPARVLASPVLHDGKVYVLQEDGTLDVVEGTGLGGYGNAVWPRYRHDNDGSGALTAGDPAPGTRSRAP